MESIDDTINHGGLLNSSLPDKHEEQLQSCLQIKPSVFLKEEDVRQSYLDHYEKPLEKIWDSSVAFWYRNEEGKFVKQDLSRIANDSVRGLGKEYHKMNAEDKKSYLSKLRAQEEYDKLQKDLNLKDGETKLSELKREIILMDAKKQDNQKMKSFANIEKLVNAELQRQEDAEV